VTSIIPCLWAETEVAPIDRGAALRELAARDRVLGAIIERIGPFALTPHDSATAFQSLARSIVYQQLSGKAAGTIFGRFRALFAGESFPSPDAVLGMRHTRMRRAGLSEAKARAIRDLAAHAARGDIPSVAELRLMPPEEVVERLTVVRGVGRWTVEMLLIIRLGHPDVLAAHDLGIRKGLARIMRRREWSGPTVA
jgi:3-methyladenine DNA glycosylase/8-oxoguanine DNA glycosylase